MKGSPVIVALMLLLLLVVGCGENKPLPPEDYMIEFQIPMSSMTVDPPAFPSDPVVVKLSGIIGPDSRYQFDHAEIEETPSSFEISLIGVRNADPNTGFLDVLVEWVDQEFQKQPPHSNRVHVVFHQPNGEILEETVVVVE